MTAREDEREQAIAEWEESDDFEQAAIWYVAGEDPAKLPKRLIREALYLWFINGHDDHVEEALGALPDHEWLSPDLKSMVRNVFYRSDEYACKVEDIADEVDAAI